MKFRFPSWDTDQMFGTKYVWVLYVQGVLQRRAILWKRKMPTKTIHEVRKGICTCCLGRDLCFLPLEWIYNLEDSLHSLQHVKIEVRNCAFSLVILVLLLLNIWCCGGQPLISKSILKVKKQMSLTMEHVHNPFLTPSIAFVGILGFQSRALHCKIPCM